MNTGRSSSDGPWRLDPDALLRRVESLHAKVSGAASECDVELYHRAALTLRVTSRGTGSGFEHRRGSDEGIALRAVTRDGARCGFAACTGASGRSLDDLLVRALAWEGPTASSPPWERSTGFAVDREGEPGLPDLESAVEWLRLARAAVDTGRGAGAPILETWLEILHTAETWIADPGLRASRVRTRVWAMLRQPSRPVVVAKRRWEGLRPEAWAEVMADRRLPAGPPEAGPTGAMAVLFNPETSALLVRSLVRRLQAGPSEVDAVVGGAWRVLDDPHREDALFGGDFDDAGFPVRPLRLADGRRAAGSLEGPGHLRRASFRDPPISLPSHLVIEPTPEAPPDRCVLVTALAIHALEPNRWVLQVDGARLEGGSPGPVLAPSFISVSPPDLVGRCVATVGPSRVSHHGVETPALLFDGLSLRR